MTGQLLRRDNLSGAIARIKTRVLAIVCALVAGVGLFLMTAWLLIRGGPHVGEHLQLLSNYFIGYSVSWWGSIVGFFYGALFGGVVGWAIGTIYNNVVKVRER